MDFGQVTTIIGLVINGLVAIGTIGLAVFAYCSIRGVVREQRQRNIYEIIGWAKSAIDWNFTEKDNEYLHASAEPWPASWIIISRHLDTVIGILRNGYVMQKIAIRFKNKGLNDTITRLMLELVKLHTDLVNLRSRIDFKANQTPPDFINALDGLMMQKRSLQQEAENVVKEAAELI